MSAPIPDSMRLRDAEAHLHAIASSMTGLDDFGDGDYREGLRRLLASCDEDADLSEAGRQAAAGIAIAALAGRLASQAARRANPGYREAVLRAPIAIVGLPRTGTTALQRMLCAIEGHQGLELWLAQSPRPRPPRDRWVSEPAYRSCVEMLAAQHRASPEMSAIHEMAADAPDECWNLLRQSFASVTFECVFGVSGYSRWWAGCDMTSAYARYADDLRLIGLGSPGARWIVKDPSHLFAPEALLAALPEATIVMTHRDPAKSIPSVCSLNRAARRANDRAFDAKRLGREQQELWARGVERMLRARERAPERIVDVHFDELQRDPNAVVARILARAKGAGTAPDPERVRAAIDAWRASNRAAPHRYSAHEFGLRDDGIRARYSDYIARCGVRIEDGRDVRPIQELA